MTRLLLAVAVVAVLSGAALGQDDKKYHHNRDPRLGHNHFTRDPRTADYGYQYSRPRYQTSYPPALQAPFAGPQYYVPRPYPYSYDYGGYPSYSYQYDYSYRYGYPPQYGYGSPYAYPNYGYAYPRGGLFGYGGTW